MRRPGGQTSRRSRRLRGVVSAALMTLACAPLAGRLLAAPAAAEPGAPYSIAIPALPLSRALALFAQQTGVSIGGGVDLRGLAGAPVSGSFSLAEALRRLLAGSGLA